MSCARPSRWGSRGVTPRLRAARARPALARERPVSKMVAAYAKDESVRLQSSCGGIFTVLAERVLDDGGVVVGVARTAPTRLGRIVVDNKAEGVIPNFCVFRVSQVLLGCLCCVNLVYLACHGRISRKN